MHRPRRLTTIVWDLDDVLNCFTAAWLELAWKVEQPECRRTFADLRANPPWRELGTSQAAYLASIDRFRHSPAARALAPHPALLVWFKRAGGRYRHAVLTARPLHGVGPGAEWVFAHFGRWIRDFHFVPSRRPGERLPSYDLEKVDVLRRLGTVDFFVDDARANVAAAQALGIRAFLFPQPWNPHAASVGSILAEIEAPLRRSRQPRKP